MECLFVDQRSLLKVPEGKSLTSLLVLISLCQRRRELSLETRGVISGERILITYESF